MQTRRHRHTHARYRGWNTPPSGPVGFPSPFPSHGHLPLFSCLALVIHQENPPGLSMVASSWSIAEDGPSHSCRWFPSNQPAVRYWTDTSRFSTHTHTHTHIRLHARNVRSCDHYAAVPLLCLRTCGGLPADPRGACMQGFFAFQDLQSKCSTRKYQVSSTITQPIGLLGNQKE